MELNLLGCPAKRIEGALEINGCEVGRFLVERRSEKVFRLSVPESIAAQEVLEGCIISKEVWRPNDYYRNGDCREFGVSVKSIAVGGKGD